MKWTIDPAHSNVDFAVRHMGISTIRGRFKQVHGTIEATEDGRLQAIEASIAASSIDTAVPERDTHLLSPDFLDAANYRGVTFRSTAVEALGGGRYRVHGEITIRNESHPTVFEVETSPTVVDPWGNRRAGATAAGTFSRKQWGLAWDQVLRFGELLVGDEVGFNLDIEVTAPVSAPTSRTAIP